MKKLQAAFFAAAASALVLAGCSNKNTPVGGTEVIESTVTSATSSESATASETSTVSTEDLTGSSAIVDDNTPPKEGMVRSKITNEWIAEELYDQRPLAVMIPNESSAIPHYGLSEASVIYECNVEANMTRLLAIFEDYESIEKLGNIRSLRDYYTYWAFEWDAILCHFGGPYYIDDIMSQSTTDNLDGNVLSKPFFRSSDRKIPHNAYLNGTEVKAILESRNIELTDRGMAEENHYNFSSPSEPNTLAQYGYAEDATYLDMTACYPVSRCYFEYNPDDNLYYRSQYLSGGSDGPHIDGTNGEQLTFSNILIQAANYAVRDQKGYLWYETVDEGLDAWYLTQGKLIKCTWKKDTEYGATRYYDLEGNEITLNTGKTMVLIIQDGDMFSYE